MAESDSGKQNPGDAQSDALELEAAEAQATNGDAPQQYDRLGD
jgi:hypothetical protein